VVQQQEWTLMLVICRAAQLGNDHPTHRFRPVDRVGLTPLSPNGEGAIMLHPGILHSLICFIGKPSLFINCEIHELTRTHTTELFCGGIEKHFTTSSYASFFLIIFKNAFSFLKELN
jgi:hypothetical protein